MILAEAKHPVLTVIDRGGRSHVLIGWTAEMVGLLVCYADRINGAKHGQVTFNFGPARGVSIGLSEPELGRSR